MTLYKSPEASKVEREALRQKGQAIIAAMAVRAYRNVSACGSREWEVKRLVAGEDDPILPGVFATDATVHVPGTHFRDRSVTLNLVRPIVHPGHVVRLEDSPEELAAVRSSLTLNPEGEVLVNGRERRWASAAPLELAVVAWDGLSRVRALSDEASDATDPHHWRADLVTLAGELTAQYLTLSTSVPGLAIPPFSPEEALFGAGAALEPSRPA